MAKAFDYDVGRQTLKYMGAAVGLGALVYVAVGSLLWPAFVEGATADHGTGPVGNFVLGWASMASVLVLVGFAMFVVMFPMLTAVKRKMRLAHKGYDVRWEIRPRKWFGFVEYDVKREDSGGLFGARAYTGFGAAAAMRRDRILRERIKEQREMACEVCGQPAGGDLRDHSYFVEHRRAFVLFGVALRRRVVDVDAFCANHRPRDWPPNG